MNRNFYPISQKINSIHAGLLRHTLKNETVTHHVVMKAFNDQTLICALTDMGHPHFSKMIGKKVTLIQKSNNDYIYLSGVVTDKEVNNKRSLHISLYRACWFVKKSKGTLSWLQEKHVYNDTVQIERLGIAS